MTDRKIRHLLNPNGGSEHAFCGLAFDAYGSGDAETDDHFVEGPNTSFNCPLCQQHIKAIREALKGCRFTGKEG